MGSEELGANLFRITQTEAKLKKDNIDNEDDACLTHYNVGRTVRKAIGKGEDLPEKEGRTENTGCEPVSFRKPAFTGAVKCSNREVPDCQ